MPILNSNLSCSQGASGAPLFALTPSIRETL